MTETPWAFNKNYSDHAQIDQFYDAYLARRSEIEADGKFPYDDSFRGHLGRTFATAKDEDSAIYLCQNRYAVTASRAERDALLARGYTPITETTPGIHRYSDVVLVSTFVGGSLGFSHYEKGRVTIDADGNLSGLLEKGKRTNGYSLRGMKREEVLVLA